MKLFKKKKKEYQLGLTQSAWELATDEEIRHEKDAAKKPKKNWLKAGIMFLNRNQLEMVQSPAYCSHISLNKS